MGLTRYPSYKPSGIEWIGEIPSHWTCHRADELFEMSKDSIDVEALKGKTWMHYSIPAVQEFGTGVLEDGDTLDSNKLLISGGELLVSKLNPRKETLTIVETDTHNKICSGEFVVLKPRKIDPRFGYFLYRSHITKERICSTVQSATKSHQRANPDDIYKIWHWIPPLPEQTAIAAYLDEKTAQIDKLIAAKRRMIELLKEERMAIINEAVSGERKGWVRKKLKYVAKVQSSGVDKKTHDDELPVRLCNYMDVYNNEFIDSTLSFMDATASVDEIGRFRLAKGDVMITKDSETPDDIAIPALVTENLESVICAYHLAHIRPLSDSISGGFLFRLFQSKEINSHFETSANGVTRFGLSLDSIKSVIIRFPSIEDQLNIEISILNETKRNDFIVAQIDHEIELLKELRVSLINEVVTGKVKIT